MLTEINADLTEIYDLAYHNINFMNVDYSSSITA